MKKCIIGHHEIGPFVVPYYVEASRKYKKCRPLDDSNDVSLMSLGGIFYVTVIGVLLSLLTLFYEVSRCAVDNGTW